MIKKVMILVVLVFGVSFYASAQATPKATKNQIRQQKRIHQGVKSGELTRDETVQLKKQQRHIKRTKRRAKADGVVTGKERRHIKRKQKRANKNIKVKKNNLNNRN